MYVQIWNSRVSCRISEWFGSFNLLISHMSTRNGRRSYVTRNKHKISDWLCVYPILVCDPTVIAITFNPYIDILDLVDVDDVDEADDVAGKTDPRRFGRINFCATRSGSKDIGITSKTIDKLRTSIASTHTANRKTFTAHSHAPQAKQYTDTEAHSPTLKYSM